jgi:hypothetical protein
MTNPPQGDDEHGSDRPATPTPGYGRPSPYSPTTPYTSNAPYVPPQGPPPQGPPPQAPPQGPPPQAPPQFGQNAPYGQPPPANVQHPQYGAPQYGQPQYGTPQYGAPQYGQPQYGQPAEKSKVGLIALITGGALLLIAGVVVLVMALQSTVLDPAAVERDVAAQFEQREGVAIELDCADGMKVNTNASYECSGTTADGESVTLKITVTDEDTAAYTWTEP